MKTIICKSYLLLFISFTSKTILATDVSLTLQVSGTIIEAPSWKDTSSNELNSVSFNFGNLITGVAASNIDSDAFSVILSDPSNASSVLTVNITTPTSCTIGGSAVIDSHVSLVHSSSSHQGSTSITFTEGASNSLQLRFSASGGYGDKAGVVSCSSPGSLTYSY